VINGFGPGLSSFVVRRLMFKLQCRNVSLWATRSNFHDVQCSRRHNLFLDVGDRAAGMLTNEPSSRRDQAYANDVPLCAFVNTAHKADHQTLYHSFSPLDDHTIISVNCFLASSFCAGSVGLYLDFARRINLRYKHAVRRTIASYLYCRTITSSYLHHWDLPGAVLSLWSYATVSVPVSSLFGHFVEKLSRSCSQSGPSVKLRSLASAGCHYTLLLFARHALHDVHE